MKINENNRVSVPWSLPARGAAMPGAARNGRDGVSLQGLAEARELLRHLPDPGDDRPDMDRVAAASARMKDGTYPVSVEDLADAILDDLATVMAWLSDPAASQE